MTREATTNKQQQNEERKRSALRRFLARCIRVRVPTKKFAALSKKVRRAVSIFLVGFFMSNSFLTMLPGTTVPPAFAASTATFDIPNVERIIPKGTPVDKMVDRFVINHMFDDDIYNPVEATLREIVDDQTTGSYPMALKTIEADVYGRDVEELLEEARQKEMEQSDDPALKAKATQMKYEAQQSQNIIFRIGLFWSNRFGLPITWSILLSVSTVLIALPTVASQLFIKATASNRQRLYNRLKRTYGKDYSTEVTEKEEEDVKLDDDDDDDDSDKGKDSDDEKK